MSTRATWTHELAARARRIGWEVELLDRGKGYQVRCPDKFVVPLHQTASDVNAHKSAERKLNEHGLAQAEAKWERKQERDRKAKLAADRRAAEARTAKVAKAAAQHSSAIAKAAGPYLSQEEVDDGWFLTAHPAMWVRWCVIGPEQAGRLLEKTNRHNRPLALGTAERYEAIIASGQWRTTHQGIAFDTSGVLQDGQHRLAAIAEAGVPAPLIVFVGMPVDNFKAIDEGRLRRAAELMAMDGEKYTSSLVGAVRLAAAYGAPDPRQAFRAKATNAQLYDAFAADAEELRPAAVWARHHRHDTDVPASVLIAGWHLLYRINGADNPYVRAFLDGVATGAKFGGRLVLARDDPRTRLRAYFANKRRARVRIAGIDALGLLVKAWNYVVEDHRAMYLNITTPPKITVCRPDGDNPSPPPPLLADEIG